MHCCCYCCCFVTASSPMGVAPPSLAAFCVGVRPPAVAALLCAALRCVRATDRRDRVRRRRVHGPCDSSSNEQSTQDSTAAAAAAEQRRGEQRSSAGRQQSASRSGAAADACMRCGSSRAVPCRTILEACRSPFCGCAALRRKSLAATRDVRKRDGKKGKRTGKGRRGYATDVNTQS